MLKYMICMLPLWLLPQLRCQYTPLSRVNAWQWSVLPCRSSDVPHKLRPAPCVQVGHGTCQPPSWQKMNTIAATRGTMLASCSCSHAQIVVSTLCNQNHSLKSSQNCFARQHTLAKVQLTYKLESSLTCSSTRASSWMRALWQPASPECQPSDTP
jgi:hypothetical protein